MSELSSGSCEPCRAGAPLLSDQELAELAADIPKWRMVEAEGIKKLERIFEHKNFVEALQFANRIGELAEKEGHHPAILVEWGKTSVQWWTHKIKGLHKNDVIMAAKTDALLAHG